MITRVSVKNYKSLADLDVELGPLTVLVGQNGAGKSNFVDVLRFVTESLVSGLERAIIDRGGISAIRRYTSKGRPPHINVSLSFDFDGEQGEFAFELAGIGEGEYEVRRESCALGNRGYEVRDRLVTSLSTKLVYAISEPTIFVLSGISERHVALLELGEGPPLPITSEEKRPEWKVREFLYNAGHYTILPNLLRTPQKPLPAVGGLAADAINLSNVLRKMKRETPEQFAELRSSLNNVVPDIADIDIKPVGGYLVVTLTHKQNGQTSTINLAQESDGTLRLLGLLTALYQTPIPPLITIEEPELTVHPGALLALYEVIKEASTRSQIVITTHSPDLISACDPSELRVVEKVNGVTRIDPLDQRQIQIINDKLFSTGDLLRIEGLQRRTSN